MRRCEHPGIFYLSMYTIVRARTHSTHARALALRCHAALTDGDEGALCSGTRRMQFHNLRVTSYMIMLAGYMPPCTHHIVALYARTDATCCCTKGMAAIWMLSSVTLAHGTHTDRPLMLPMAITARPLHKATLPSSAMAARRHTMLALISSNTNQP